MKNVTVKQMELIRQYLDYYYQLNKDSKGMDELNFKNTMQLAYDHIFNLMLERV
jgi:hypothetical protein